MTTNSWGLIKLIDINGLSNLDLLTPYPRIQVDNKSAAIYLVQQLNAKA